MSYTNILSEAVDSYFISDLLMQFAEALLRMIGETWEAADSRPLRFLFCESWGGPSTLE